MGYYTGSYSADAQNPAHWGWLVGSFMEGGPRKTDAVEIKYSTFPAGPTDHPAKVSAIIECTFILSGKIQGTIGGQQVTLQAGDYFVIEPGTPNNLFERVLEEVTTITVKAPSDPSAKQVVDKA